MAYSVDTYSRSKTFVVEDGTINNSLDILLLGKNYAGYGEVQNENLVHMLENFAGTTAPPKPLNGQIWYDTTIRSIKVYDAASLKWKTTGAAEVSEVKPTGMATGTLWWDEVNGQLYIFNGSTYVLVGPQAVSTLGTTEVKSLTLTDSPANPSDPVSSYPVIAAYINGEIVYIISSAEFDLSIASLADLGGPTEFSRIKKGITLRQTNAQGRANGDYIYWGTSSDSLKLSGYEADDFFKKTDFTVGEFTNVVKFGDAGFTVGVGTLSTPNDLEIKIDTDGSTPVIRTTLGSELKLQTKVLGSTVTPLALSGHNIVPGADNATDLGSASLRFKQVRAVDVYGSFNGDGFNITNIDANKITGNISVGSITGTLAVDITGTAENADHLLVGSVYRSASVSAPDAGIPNTIAVRDDNGDLNATVFRGTATAALYADLAEKYLADQEYEVGTVVAVGGPAEVTACQAGDRAFGAVSANPAFKMNDGLSGGTYIALKGRVPIKVSGPVNKGDKLIAHDNGSASVVVDKNVYSVFAVALETNLDSGIKLVESVIL